MTLSVPRPTEKMLCSYLFSRLFVGPLGLQWFQISFIADVAPVGTLRYLGVISKFGFECSLPPRDKIIPIVGCEVVYNFASRLLVNQELTHWLCLAAAFPGKIEVSFDNTIMPLVFLCFVCFPTNISKLICPKERCLFQNNHPLRVNVRVL